MSGALTSASLPQIPNPLTSLVGRELEIEAVQAYLLRDEVRLVTITGPGGVGKTRLALAVSASVKNALPAEVHVISLAGLTQGAQLIPFIAHSLGVRASGSQDPQVLLQTFLRRRRILLVLDNFEHILDGAPALGELLAGCPSVTALVTSRALLRIAGEQAFPLLPLAVPPSTASGIAGHIDRFDAVQLFVSRCRSVQPDFAVTPDNELAIADVCRRLDGLPLALELAASRVNLFTPEVLLERLNNRLPALAAGPRDAPSRLQSLDDAIGWSYDLLDTPQQALLRRLSIFAGGFSLAAAESIAEASSGLQGDITDLLGALLDQSLLRMADAGSGRSRFFFLETIRDFARRQLEEHGELDDVAEFHARYFLAMARQSQAGLWGRSQVAWLDRLETEHPNIRAALDWLLENRPEQALELAESLGRYWIMHCHLREGHEWLDRCLEAAPFAEPAIVARGLYAAGMLQTLQGNHHAAIQQGEHALWLAAGDCFGEGMALSLLSHAYGSHGELDEAVDLADRSLRHFEQSSDTAWTAYALNRLAVTLLEEGHADRAEPLYRRAEHLWREQGNDWGLALTLDGLAQIAQMDGRFEKALQLRRASLRVCWQLGDIRNSIDALIGIAGTLASAGDTETAARLMGAAQAYAVNIGFLPYAFVVRNRAQAIRLIDDGEHAERNRRLWEMGSELSLGDAVACALAAQCPPHAPGEQHSDRHPLLTPREMEILRQLATGKSNQDIADTLFLGRGTVKSHVGSILSKLGVASRTEAAAHAYQNGLIGEAADSAN